MLAVLPTGSALPATERRMKEPQVDDSPTPVSETTPDRRRTPRAVVPPPARRSAALFPHQTSHAVRVPSRIRDLAWEAISERRNLIPLGLMIVFAMVGISLLVKAEQQRAVSRPDELFAHFTISSDRPGTSLFGNDRYLGEVGPAAREFAVPPGDLRLRVVHSYCRAWDTTVTLELGARRSIGPVNPLCDHP